MKPFLFIGICSLLLSCTGATKDDTAAFIPGMYIRELQDEYTSGMDTLIISLDNPETGVYRIERRSGYQQQLDGKLLTPQHKVENWTATYDREHGQLHEQRKGKVLTFVPEQNKLSLGGSEYRKTSE